MNRQIEYGDLLKLLHALPKKTRSIVAIAGAPGSGKSTIAEKLFSDLTRHEKNRAEILPMDGYHLDDGLLEDRGTLKRKGSPNTFDVDGLHHMLKRIKCADEHEVIVPTFDRSLEISRAGARHISADTEIILVEGNYLLSNEEPWHKLRSNYDLTIMINVSEKILKERLSQRWLSYDYTEDVISQKLELNDLPNGRYVYEKSEDVDYIYSNE
ncbi:MAG: nucleoside/nucleotide kinase family protein [Rhizobiales bacterium]|nr:nucleoside/nucleotide kinase family protein [Hyphomicrobiales bacterium]